MPMLSVGPNNIGIIAPQVARAVRPLLNSKLIPPKNYTYS